MRVSLGCPERQRPLDGWATVAASSEFDPAQERGPLAWMAKNAVAANVLMLILIVGGLVTLGSGIKQEVFPEVDLDVVVVDVVYPGASPAEVEQAVSSRSRKRPAASTASRRFGRRLGKATPRRARS